MKKQIETAIKSSISDAEVQIVEGSPGHYSIVVRSASFVDRSSLVCQKMVYSAIAFLMKGDNAPVHAIDKLETFSKPSR